MITQTNDPQLLTIPRSISASAACSMPSRSASVAGQQQPGVGDGVGVVKAGAELVQGVAGCHRERALLIGIRQLSQASFSQVRGPFSESEPASFHYCNGVLG